ncbi:M20/M25/M40 family metallo-hydrolase [Streptomyces sp. JV185]|uniref:M20/M25/M40 family metallo-hydrolase n=1 Tax=Streptomyces sp. JV185 TaxID=858638 RepID=UPI002E77CADA|nr:M20/M25/M40 family metallo-hydrolase [Streptomyces sp. JV185]MEE1769078.1 M20/M25/M40 family metallo-hydrolase [Streptomyces sp. JV185]
MPEVRHRVTAALLLSDALALQPRYLADLERLVSVDSGSYSPEGVNRVGAWTARRLTGLGFEVERKPVTVPGRDTRFGDVVVGRLRGRIPAEQGGRRILLAGHLDTVFDDGTAARRPFTRSGRLAHGPGVSDDKGGLLAGLTAVEVLLRRGLTDFAEIVFLATPDEEIGSPASRRVTAELAASVDYGLGLECARENGDLVIARKGVADFLITVTGRAAHAGIEPERGANAALAAAHLLIACQEMNGRWDDVTVNVGMVRAGSRINIVCPEAELHVEVRSSTGSGIQCAGQAIAVAAAQLSVPGTTATVRQTEACPAMEDTPAALAVFARAREAGSELGLDLGAAATGGVGDANTIAGAGVPTLDGLGPVGGGDHSSQEWLDVTTVPHRVALLAALITDLGSTAAAGPDARSAPARVI